jgi:hypothetical protein
MSHRFNHTVGAGPNRLLVVAVIDGLRDSSCVSSISYGGGNLTRVW